MPAPTGVVRSAATWPCPCSSGSHVNGAGMDEIRNDDLENGDAPNGEAPKVRVLTDEPADKLEAKQDAGWFRRHAKPILITLGVMVLIVGVMWQRCGIKGCPDVGTLKGYMPDEASTIVDYKGAEIGKLFLTRRTIVPFDSLPEHVPNAFIAMEDKRFWDHNGVDWRRVGGAAYRNI